MSEKLEALVAAYEYVPVTAATAAAIGALRKDYQYLVKELDDVVAPCHALALALVRLEESAMWAMKALSHYGMRSKDVTHG